MNANDQLLRPRRAGRRRRGRAAAQHRARSTSRARAPTSACRCARSRRATRPRSFGAEKNPPLVVYDTSGPYTDPPATIDIRRGLPALRAPWIAERGDTRRTRRPHVRPTAARASPTRSSPACASTSRASRSARRRRRQRHADALRAARHRHAGDGVRRDPREPAARARCSRTLPAMVTRQHPGQSFGAAIPEVITPGVRPRRSRARPRDHPGQHQPPGEPSR